MHKTNHNKEVNNMYAKDEYVLCIFPSQIGLVFAFSRTCNTNSNISSFIKILKKQNTIVFNSDQQVHLFHEHSSVQVYSTKLELSSVQVQYFSGDNNWTKFISLEKVK